jgi:hypothetical protein
LAVRAGEPLTTAPYFNSSSAAYQVVVDAAGNSYLVGGFQGRVRFGTTILNAGPTYTDLFVAKLDPAGNYLWVVQAGGLIGNEFGQSIALDASGNIYITGGFTGPTSTFGTTTLANTTPTLPGTDILVAKLTNAGQWVWAVSAGGTLGEDGKDIKLDALGNIYITGEFNSPQLVIGSTTLVNLTTTQSSDAFVAKLDATGNWLWGVRAGGTGSEVGNGLAVEASGNVYFVGSMQSPTVTFGSITLAQTSPEAAFVAKLAPNGTYLWARTGGSSTSYYDGQGIALDAASNVYITGTFAYGSITLGTTTLANAGSSDFYVAQLNGAGQWGWATRAGGAGIETGTHLVADGRGSVYVMGYYEGAALPIGATLLPYQGTIHDWYVAKLAAATGAWRWAVRAGGTENDVSMGLTVDSRQAVYVAGYYQSPSLSLAPLTLPGNSNFANGSGFLARLAPDPEVRIAGDSLLCGPATQLSAIASAPIAAYQWSTGATTPTIMVTQPGTYAVTVTFSGGLTSTTQFQVRRFTPAVYIRGDSLLCAGSPAILTAVPNGPVNSYQWSTGATTPAISVTQPGNYTVTVQYGTACTATAQQAVRLPTLRLTGDTQLCAAGSSLLVTAVAPGATAFRWNTGATTPSLTVTQAGTYSVVATFATGCTLTATQLISQATLTVRGDTLLCPGRSATLTAALATSGTYQWSTGATTPTIAVTQPGTYTVTARATSAPFCVITKQVQVQTGFLPPPFTLGADTTLCEYQTVVLHAPALAAPATYRWSDGSTGPSLRVTQTGTYALRLITSCGERTASRRVTYQGCLFIPNIITPNDDQQNDVFVVKGLPPGNWELTLYNRLGKQVFTTPAYAQDWGRQAAPGVYYYLLRQASAVYKGWVEVVR